MPTVRCSLFSQVLLVIVCILQTKQLMVNKPIRVKRWKQIALKVLLVIKQLLDEVEHDIMNYQNRGLCYLPKPKVEADNTDTRFC